MAYRSNRYDNRRPKYKKPPESRPSRPQSFAKHRYDFGDKEKREIREVTGDRCLRCGIQEHELDLLLAQACEKCDLNDADKNCNSGCDITSDRHLEIHHTVSKWFAAENKMDSKVIGSLNMGVCLCNECHKIMDRLAQQPDSEDDLRTLYELGKRDLSTQEITNLFRRARTKSYLAEIFTYLVQPRHDCQWIGTRIFASARQNFIKNSPSQSSNQRTTKKREVKFSHAQTPTTRAILRASLTI